MQFESLQNMKFEIFSKPEISKAQEKSSIRRATFLSFLLRAAGAIFNITRVACIS